MDEGDEPNLMYMARSVLPEPIVPPRQNFKIRHGYDKAAYKRRNANKRMFCRFKGRRRIATRLGRNVTSFMGVAALAVAAILGG